MAALGKRQREGDLLTGRCPREEPQFQTHRAEGIPHPDVSHMESEGLAPCLGPPPYAGRVGWVPAAHLSHSRGKASLLQEDTAKPSQQLSQEALAQCYPQAPQDRSQDCGKPKAHNKDCESRTERRKEVKFWNFSYFISGS